jgi:hypothetical protein
MLDATASNILLLIAGAAAIATVLQRFARPRISSGA